jgi:predicted GIY-YIG superfamily endonuclease
MDCSRAGPTVYILECADGSYYVGLAREDLDRRVWEHQTGYYAGYTSRRRPVVLKGSWEFSRYDEAIAFERQVKGWGRAKKQALIFGDFKALPELARCRSRRE